MKDRVVLPLRHVRHPLPESQPFFGRLKGWKNSMLNFMAWERYAIEEGVLLFSIRSSFLYSKRSVYIHYKVHFNCSSSSLISESLVLESIQRIQRSQLLLQCGLHLEPTTNTWYFHRFDEERAQSSISLQTKDLQTESQAFEVSMMALFSFLLLSTPHQLEHHLCRYSKT